ncbi:MAG TPA: serine hydrolase [Candidatus Dormibacteraeota bacterium]|nr:serine hydrolase [Candidatus Dormibacteraeota bacterium]
MTPPLPEPLAREARRLEAGFSGVLALWVHDLRHRESYGLRAEEAFPSASTIKLFVLRELFRQVEAGHLSLDDDVVLRRRDAVPGTGVLKDLRPGLRLRLRDSATLMISVSDNVAANLLIERLGTAAINRATRDAGYAATRLGGKLFRARSRNQSTTTARDAGRLLLELARGRAVSRAASGAMLRILRLRQPNEIVGRLIACEDVCIASKGGTLPGVRHDVAYVQAPPARYVVALLSRDCVDDRPTVDNEAVLCLAHVARAVHEHASRP